MNTATPAAPENFAAELVRRGLPIEYAQRAAEELADHQRDLVDELRASGQSESDAQAEAIRRLGSTHTLVEKAAREYQRRFWCGRWPLMCFVLAPVPLFWSVCFVASWVSILTYETLSRVAQWLGMTAPAPATIALLKLVFLGGASVVLSPLILTYFFYRLSRRSGCGRQWALVSVCQVAFLASLFCFQMDGERGKLFFEPAMLRGMFFAPTFAEFLQSYFVQPSQALQFAVPMAAFAAFVWIERRKRTMLDRPGTVPA